MRLIFAAAFLSVSTWFGAQSRAVELVALDVSSGFVATSNSGPFGKIALAVQAFSNTFEGGNPSRLLIFALSSYPGFPLLQVPVNGAGEDIPILIYSLGGGCVGGDAVVATDESNKNVYLVTAHRDVLGNSDELPKTNSDPDMYEVSIYDLEYNSSEDQGVSEVFFKSVISGIETSSLCEFSESRKVMLDILNSHLATRSP